MVWIPAVRVAVPYVAVLEPLKVPVPKTVVPSLKATVPLGTTEPIAGVTVAVNVTLAPKLAVGAEDATVVVVATIETVTDIALDTEGAKLVSPEYCAVIPSVPTGRGVASVAAPAAPSVAVPKVLVPDRNVSVPVGMTTFPVGPTTVAVRITNCPASAVLADACRTVVVAAGTI
jgi:hypothetical protein